VSRVRFKGTTSASIPTPPIGRASLYFDDSDNSLKLKLDSGMVVALGVTEEYIQDLMGAMVTSSGAIDVSYDDNNAIISIDLKPSIIDDTYVDKISPTKIIDDLNGRDQATIITNNNVASSVYSLDCSMDGMWMVELRITARRIGGLAGIPGSGAVFKRTFRVKSYGSSVTVHDLQADFTSRDVPTLNTQVSVSGTDVNVLVIGLINNNIKWNVDIVSSINI
jgi:hypothetical protein